MDRTACINLPFFSIQLLLRRQPSWSSQPVAVVDADKPQGTILQVNALARANRILPGMRYAAGLALDGGLRAAVVPQEEVNKSVLFISHRLRSFSPRVEPASDESGVFWLDADGLERLHGSLTIWAKHIQSEMEHNGFQVTVVVGFTCFGSYLLAKAGHGISVLKNPQVEHTAARQVPIECLGVEPETIDCLEKLGIKTVGQFVNLPSSGIISRFGLKVYQLHLLAAGELRLPLQPEYPLPPAMQKLELDHPEVDIGRIMTIVQRLLTPLLQTLSDRGHALTEILVWFHFDKIGQHVERIRPAAPTLDNRQLLDLIRLRLHSLDKLSDGVVATALVGRSVAAVPKQVHLLEMKPKRDSAAGNRALARVRAELGEHAVVYARLREGHLPEARFVWENLDMLSEPKPRKTKRIPLIRRLYSKPRLLAAYPDLNTNRKIRAGLQMGLAKPERGPYVISGGWWKRPVHREYYYADSRSGEVQWVYFDRVRKKWFLQGRVE